MSNKIGIQCGIGNQLNTPGKLFKAILEHNGYSVNIIELDNLKFLTGIEGLNYYIFPFVHYDSEVQIADTLMPIVEIGGNTVTFPNWDTRWHYNDKAKEYVLLKKIGVDSVDTKIFWDIESASEWLIKTEYPIIFKLKGGASSLNVVKLQDKKSAEKIVKQAFSYQGIKSGEIPDKNSLHFGWNITKLFSLRRRLAEKRGKLGPQGAFPYWQIYRDQVIFQKYLSNNDFDTRITIIGDVAFAYRRWNREDDFRASGSGKIDYDISQIDKRCITIAFQVSKKLNFQSMAYDFLFNENGDPEIVEFSYKFVDVLVYRCPGHFDEKLGWHEGNIWPQIAILWALLDDKSLEQPNDLELIK